MAAGAPARASVRRIAVGPVDGERVAPGEGSSGKRAGEHGAHDQGIIRVHRKFRPEPDGRGICEALRRRRIKACSAGMEPSRLNPFAVVMREKGIDISRHHSKAFDWDLARQMDVVITVCGHANESCPILPPEVKRLHWPLEDPRPSGERGGCSGKFRKRFAIRSRRG